MNFFVSLHRSVLEPGFYREAIALPRREIAGYFFKLLFFFALITAGADTWYLINGQRGIPRMLAAAFPGMALRDGILQPAKETPYVVPSYLVAPILNQLLGLPAMFNPEAESLVVVDTARRSNVPLKVPVILLKAREAVVVLAAGTTMEFTYENILFGTRDLDFTVDQIGRFLKRHIGTVFFGYFFSTLLHQGVLFLFSIFFLALAAYIFRVERKRTLKEYLKTSTFAISPLAVGSALVAISGVKIEWIWHMLIFLSTIVMFRAIIAISSLNKVTTREL
ncbi:MAG: DUF1189 family protein [Chitinispirillaceae bacterium]|nr:DUF1189 family protein [Chitinispirillaceae bacterium]